MKPCPICGVEVDCRHRKKEVQRYAKINIAGQNYMDPHKEGEWVKHEDYKKLKDKLEEVEK